MSLHLLPEEIRLSGDALGGRSAPARREILRLLKTDLPGQIALCNQIEGLHLPEIQAFRFARPTLEGIQFPAVLVSAAPRVVAIAPRVMKRVTQIQVFFVAGPLGSAAQLDDYLDIAELIELSLKPRQSGHLLPDGAGQLAGRRAWNTLSCEGIGDLPADWKSHAGHTVSFEMDQAGCKLWPQP